MQPTSQASSLVIRLFGPFEVQVNGQPLGRLRFRKSESVLALLALRRGAPVERRWLSGLLWPESLDGQMLRNCLSDLRRALGPEAGRLRSPAPQTLALDLSQATVDVLAFDDATARGDPASLAEAVALRRGPLLEGCTEEWAFQEQQRREPVFLAALEKLAALALEQGRLADAEQHLRLAVATDPLRESAQRALMRLLATGGNYAAALLCYRELRLRLHRELNTEPDAETQTLFQQLRGEAPRLAAKHSGASVPGPDARRRAPVAGSPPLQPVHPDPPADFPPLHSQEALRHNLPAPLTRFIGREREIAELKRLLKTTRLLTLTGAGGGGKTRLALQVAADLLEEYADGVWLAELASLAEPKLVPHAVAAALGLREEPHRPLTATLADRLRARTLLLVLDNCEHLLPACGGLAEMLLQRCPALRILATSRERLRVAGETTYRVPPLSLPAERALAFRSSGIPERPSPAPEHRNTQDHRSAGYPPQGGWMPPEDLMQSEAALLFLDRAAAARPSFTLTRQNAAAIVRVCLQLDGIPLAIELAAARVNALPVEEIAARLDDRFRLLTEGSRTSLPRHRTLQALIDWSYDLLSEPEQRLLRHLSVFAGGWTLEAAESVGAGDRSAATPGAEAWEVLDRLTSLVEKSLVLYEERGSEGRYRLLETVRQYARDRLQEAGEEEAARDRHGAFCLQLAEAAHAAAGQGRGAVAFERLEPEHDNLRAALAWSDGRAAERMLRLAGALWEFWHDRGYWDEGRQWLERALASAPGAEPTAERARALAAVGRLATHQRDCSVARNRLEESIALYRRLGDTRGLVEALTQRSLALFLCESNAAVARGVQEEAVAQARALGDPRLLASALSMLGFVMEGHETARVVLEESLTLARQVGDGGLMALSLERLGVVSQVQGEGAQAREFLEESVELARAANMKVHLCNALLVLANVLFQQGDPERAKSLREECLLLARELRLPMLIGRAICSLAAHDPSYEEALRRIEQAVRDYGPREAKQPLVALGHAARERGDYDWAATFYRRSLALRQEVGDTFAIAKSLEEFAGLAARQEQWERAATLLGAAEGVCVATGRTPPVATPEEYERAERGARTALGEAAFAVAWAEGRVMTLKQAIAYALEEPANA